ncbi:hypothetical protein ACHHYP_13821 [Achlya hypogyna]|uniref:KATNIP domain-containing protein n=1 Tax=Achlya hypogyna TaxID=1202772 RepID=A0A1V9ZFA5_ACHHY|nr:hypothetical protein ACHHYP_13821 [Achlya hypogyna]
MTEHRKERKWAKTATATIPTLVPATADGPATEKQREYIRVLEERNRIKKKLEEQSKNDRDLEEKETGFSTNFNGENAARKPASRSAKPRAKSAGATKLKNQGSAGDLRPRAEPKRETKSTSALPLHAPVDEAAPRVKHKWTKPQGAVEQRDGRIVFRDLAADTKESVSLDPAALSPHTDIEAQQRAPVAEPAPTTSPIEPTSAPIKAAAAPIDAVIAPADDDEEDDEDYMDESFETFDDDGGKCESPRSAHKAPSAAALQPTAKLLNPVLQPSEAKEHRPATLQPEPKHTSSAGLQPEPNKAGLLHHEPEAALPTPAPMPSKEPPVGGTSEMFAPDPMSQTTRELVSLIHGLSRDKQKDLIQRLNKFTTSDKQAADVSELQRSIGDPSIWSQLLAPVAALSEQQRAWDAEIEAKLERERAEKEALLAQAEARRVALLRQLDAEEQELQQLLTRRRQETLEKLRQVEAAVATPPTPTVSETLPPAPVASPVKAKPTLTGHEVRVKLLSSWGNTRVVGLTQISVYDMEGNELEVATDSLKLFSGQADGRPIPKSNAMVRDLARLFNGVAHTTRETDMWLGRQIDANPLQMAFTVDALPSKLCIWNYNSKLQAACVRDIEVFVDGQCKWTGSLPETTGAEDGSACTWINVVASMRKKPPAPPVATASPPLTEPPRASTTGPIWLAAKTTAAAPPPEPKEPNLTRLDLSRVTEEQTLRQSTSRRRLLDGGEATPRIEPTTRTDAAPVAPVRAMPSLQSSWDTLEHFKKTNRSRLPLEASPRTTYEPVARVAEVISTRVAIGDTPRAPVTDVADTDVPQAARIPELPRGRTLVFEWLSTWGDPYYIGLNGIDVFDATGALVRLTKAQVSATPASINVLPEYAASADPRVADNLVDGVNYTCDDLHMWLAPFTPGQRHAVTLQLAAPTTLAMLRIWNYNKSRAHSFRGVKDTRILLDGREVFAGEVRKAPGILGAVDQCSEVVLFTTDEAVLRAIELIDADPTVDATPLVVDQVPAIPRPTTAEEQANLRPKTSVATSVPRTMATAVPATSGGRRGRCLKLVFQSTWGDRNYVGLTGLQLFVQRGPQTAPVALQLDQLSAEPRDLHSLGYDGDPRTLDKLIDGVDITCDDTHMWLVPFGGPKAPELTIVLATEEVCVAVAFWNYNKSAEDTARGAKAVSLFLDGRCIATTVLRKAPGHALFDYRQLVSLQAPMALPPPASVGYRTHVVRQDYEAPLHPSGFVLKVVLWSTWGDPYYVGLNGLEVFDASGTLLPAPSVLVADPAGLDGSPQDVRVVGNLFLGDNNTWDAAHAWLATLASSVGRSTGNTIYVVYEAPVTIAMIKVYNYSKTPDRGAREIEIYLDDLKVYMGTLRQAPPAPGVARTGKLQQTGDFGQPILFTLNPAIVEGEKRKLLYCGAEEQDVLCINEGQVVVESKAMYRAPDPGAEGVVVDLLQRPTTAMHRQ